MSLPTYSPGEAGDYCASKGWSTKRSGEHLVLDCPLCSTKGKFYLNDMTGLWDCKSGSCGQRGNFYQLKKTQGDVEPVKPLYTAPVTTKKKAFPLSANADYESALQNSPEALAYLASRGLTKETAAEWHLGYKVTADGVHQLIIPYVHRGQIVDVKYRLLPKSENGSRPKYTRYGGDSVLYGEQTLAAASRERVGANKGAGEGCRDTLYIVEGEFDVMTMWQRGYWPAVSTTTGAASFKAEWFDQIVAFDPAKIVVIYDSDAAGQKGAAVLLKKFEDRSIVNVVLEDVKDVSDYFVAHTQEDFDRLLQAAEPKELENVISMSRANDMLIEQLWFSTEAFDGIPSKFPDVNAMIEGGYWNGQLVVITGPSGTGKTSLVLDEFMTMAVNNIAPYLLCLEMPPIMMQRKIYQKVFGIPMLKLTQAHVEEGRKQLDKLPMFIGGRQGCKTLKDVEKLIRSAVSRHNLKIVAFDNLNYFVRSIEHTSQEIAATTQMLKDLAIDLNIPIIAIAQPKKFDKESKIMSAADLKDSSAIEQDADTIIILHRQRTKTDVKDFGKNGGFIGNQSPYCLVRVEKARYSSGGETYLYFDGARSGYRELTADEKTSMQRG
jgi:replicative DNA helicase